MNLNSRKIISFSISVGIYYCWGFDQKTQEKITVGVKIAPVARCRGGGVCSPESAGSSFANALAVGYVPTRARSGVRPESEEEFSRENHRRSFVKRAGDPLFFAQHSLFG